MIGAPSEKLPSGAGLLTLVPSVDCRKGHALDISLDNQLSKHLGVDNELAAPHRSISCWAIVFIALCVPAREILNHSFVSSRVVPTIMPIAVAAAILALFWYARMNVAELASELPNDASRKRLRVVSGCLLRITGLVLFVMAANLLSR